MYKMSEVIYRLDNGTVVNTLKEAKASGCRFTKMYLTIEEDFFNSEESKTRRVPIA